MTKSREVRLTRRPKGMPTQADFEIATVDVGAPGDGEVQIRNTWMSVDPYMRGRMYDGPSYAAPFQVGEAMTGGAVGDVVASNSSKFAVGDKVQSMFGWRETFNAKDSELQKLDTHGLPEQLFLGALGMPGLTAYVGVKRIIDLKAGETIFVSAASGAVGQMVCQIAKQLGATVIGSAGGAEKVAFLKEIGCDAAIDYKAVPDLTRALLGFAPAGIDAYFENVGGEHLEAAITAAKPHARFAFCGMISGYNSIEANTAPKNLVQIVGKQLKWEGFIVSTYASMGKDFARDVGGWIATGKVQTKETVEHGVENAAAAFLKLFTGDNFGKMLVKL